MGENLADFVTPLFMRPRRRLFLSAIVATLSVVALSLWFARRDEVRTTERAAVAKPQPPPAPVPPEKKLLEGTREGDRKIMGRAWADESESAMDAFAKWTARYLAADAKGREALLAEGVKLAEARRSLLAQWIQKDPERALAAAVPVMARKQLPEAIHALLEERISGEGTLSLIGATPAPGGTVRSPLFRKSLIGDREFYAHTYGRRGRLPTIPSASITGIALDGHLAVSDSPIRVLEAGETAGGKPVEEVCPVSGITSTVSESKPLNVEPDGPTAIEAGGKVTVVCQPAHVSRIEADLIRHEQGGHRHNLGDNLPGTSGVSGRPPQSWTHGPKKLLIIRVDFQDLQGPPLYPGGVEITEDYVVDVLNNDPNNVRDFFEEGSFGKTSIITGATVSGDSPDVTEVLRMPETASIYAVQDKMEDLHSDARSAAQVAGFDVNSYDRIGVVFKYMGSIPNSKVKFGGLGNVEGRNFWINGYFDFRVVTHELGHTYGLHHSNRWQVSGSTPVSEGLSDEYGDPFDIMGNGSNITHHFSHWNKSILQWIPDTAVQTVAVTGTHRLYRFDRENANLMLPRALKVVRNRDQDYWIGLRRETTNASLDGGAYILWGYNENQQGDLLAFSSVLNNLSDAGLETGSTFADTAAGITIKPLAQGGSDAEEWIDVQLILQPRISWAQAEFVVDEQIGTAVLTLNREHSGSGTVSVNYATSPGTATATADYTTSSGTVTWAPGDLAPKTISIPIIPDALVEGTHQFTVTLSGISNGAVIVNSPAAKVTIADPGARDKTFTAEFIDNTVEKILPLPNGDFLLGGQFGVIQNSNFVTYDRCGILYMYANGRLEPQFAGEGGAAGAGSGNSRVTDIARQPDGKLIAVGEFTSFNGVARNRVVRLHPDGTVDTTFNPGTGANGPVNAVLLQPDGKILIGGAFTSYNGTAREYLARLNADGSLDTSFTGPSFADINGWQVNCLALQPDGKLLVGGVFYFNGGGGFKAGLCRVTSTGALDGTFNGITDGAHLHTNLSELRDIYAIELEMDGHILIAGGFTAFNGTPRGGLARLTSTGALDGSYVTSSDGPCNALLLQPDGRLIVGGEFTTFNGEDAERVVRLSSAGVVETGFVAGGGADDDVKALALQADGRVLIGGNANMNFQDVVLEIDSAPIWRFFGGLPGLPGTVQLTGESFSVAEGTDAQVTVSRVGGSSGVLSVGYSTVPGTADDTDFTATSGVLSWADGDSTPKTIQVPILFDPASDTGETFVVNLGEPLRHSTPLGALQRATVTVSGTIYESWFTSNFNETQQGNPAISGLDEDPDLDGLSNRLEFAFNLPAMTPGTLGRPVPGKVVDGGETYLTLTFRRRVIAPGLTYTPLTNGGLPGTWLENALQVGSAVNNGDGTETVTFRDATPLPGNGQRFMQLEVLHEP